MNRPELVRALQELARLGYWYGERTGDYSMENLFEEDEEAMQVAEEVAKALQDKQAIIDHIKVELMRALSQYDMVAAHNAELKAQAEQLMDSASEVIDDYFDYLECYGIDSEDMGTIQKRKYDLMVALKSATLNTLTK